MELVKQNENIVKDYSTDVNGIETINNISFQIKDSAKHYLVKSSQFF